MIIGSEGIFVNGKGTGMNLILLMCWGLRMNFSSSCLSD